MYVWYCILFIYDNDLYYLNIIYIMFMLGSFVYMNCIYTVYLYVNYLRLKDIIVVFDCYI